MIRVLFIARYRDATMMRKVELLASQPDLSLLLVCPRTWRDELIATTPHLPTGERLRAVALPMIGAPSDPHRAFYRTFSFGLRAFRPHIIHAEEEPDSLAALQVAVLRRLWAPRARLLLHTWQNLDRPKGLAVRAVLAATLGAADAVFAANLEAEQLLRREGFRRPVVVLPAVGVDTDVFAPRPAHVRAVESSFVLGYVGRLVEEKGLDTLLEAMAQLCGPDAPVREARLRVLMVGNGPQLPALREMIRTRGLGERVEMLPPVSPGEVAGVMRRLDALVLPSRTTPTWKEQFGRVLVEAMASGVPVIGSDSGAIPEVIGEAGLLFAEGDAGALAECVRQLMDAPALAAALTQRGIARATSCFSQAHLAAQTALFYRQVVSW